MPPSDLPAATRNIVSQLTLVIDALRDATNAEGSISGYDIRRIGTRARSAIARFAPPNSPYIVDADEIAESDSASSWKAEQLAAIVHALRDDYAGGGLVTIAEVVHADLFDDFLDMAAELLSKGFIGPAAVLAGSVLEEHIHKLATKHAVALDDDRARPKSVEMLGVDLRNSGAVSEVQRKSLTAWYAQRSEGAHGRAENLHAAELERMIDGIRDFIGRHAA
jgi:hypothetical protein